MLICPHWSVHVRVLFSICFGLIFFPDTLSSASLPRSLLLILCFLFWPCLFSSLFLGFHSFSFLDLFAHSYYWGFHSFSDLIVLSYCPLFRFFPWRVFLFLPSLHFVKLPFLLSPPSVSFPSFHHLASFPGLPPTTPFFVANFISLPLYLSFFFNLSFPCRTFLLRFCLSFLRCSLIYFLSLPHFSFLASFSCALFFPSSTRLFSNPLCSLILSSIAAYFHLFSPFHSFSSDASSSCRTYLARSSHVLSFCFLMCPHLPFVCIPPPSSSSSSSLYLSVLAFQYCSIPNAQHLLISSFQTYPFLLDFSNGKRKTVHVGVCKWLLEIHIDRTSCGRRAGGFFFFPGYMLWGRKCSWMNFSINKRDMTRGSTLANESQQLKRFTNKKPKEKRPNDTELYALHSYIIMVRCRPLARAQVSFSRKDCIADMRGRGH